MPVNFQAILIHPNKKNTKRLRDVLNQLYGHLDGSAASSGGNADVSYLKFNVCVMKIIVCLFFCYRMLISPDLGLDSRSTIRTFITSWISTWSRTRSNRFRMSGLITSNFLRRRNPVPSQWSAHSYPFGWSSTW